MMSDHEGLRRTGRPADVLQRALRFAERLLVAFGIVLCAVYGAIQVHGSLASGGAMQRFYQAASEGQFADTQVDTSLWSDTRIEAYRESLANDLGLPLAILHIPAIKLSVPVLPGTDTISLNRGVGNISGTTAPGGVGNIGIAGHRDGFFRGLKDLQIGDRIRLETLSGEFSYVIQDLMVVEPHEVEVLDPKDTPTLTLVTCYPFYFVGPAPQRFVVVAIGETPAATSNPARMAEAIGRLSDV